MEKYFFVGVGMSFRIDNQIIMCFYVGKNCQIVALLATFGDEPHI